LKTAGLAGKNFKGQVKILGTGTVSFPITLKNIKASKGVQEKIGGIK
jgi:ribosomal protein L15